MDDAGGRFVFLPAEAVFDASTYFCR